MSSSLFTCITCRVAFADADLQRTHYKTDWHRYNLKRKVAQLPPVSLDGFTQRLIAQKAQASEEEKPSSCYCAPCGKHFGSEGAYANHLHSAKHKKVLATRGEVEDGPKPAHRAKQEDTIKVDESVTTSTHEDEEDDDWDTDALGLEECLFCDRIAKSLEANVKHMTSAHNFFIPDLEYLVDMEGLISYLGEKVGVGKLCLWCNEKTKPFQTVAAVRQHMTDKGHCMLNHHSDTIYEYADYYDYSSSYPEGETAAPDEEVEPVDISSLEDGYQMTLPSGKTVGHRSLAKYYKQNLISRLNPEGKSVLKKIMGHYKALGWTGATEAKEQRLRVKDLGYMQRKKQRFHQRLGVKSNKTSQMHFREQIMF